MFRKVLTISAITIVLCAFIMLCFEYFLRQGASYITKKTLDQADGIVEFNPEFLVEYTGNQRRLRPNVEVVINNHYLSGIDVPVRVNSLGFRGEELKPKQENEYRILFLGDSITIGDYLREEDVFPWITQAKLQERFPDKKISIAVAAITNLGLEEELALLAEKGLSTQPDVVVLNFYLNDSRPPWGFAGETGNRGWLRKHSILAETIYTNLLESNWKQEQQELRFGWLNKQNTLAWKNDRKAFLKLAKSARYDWGAAWETDSWEIVQQGFQELKSLADKSGFKVLVSILPVSFQVYADFIEDSPQQKLKEISKTNNFSSLDLLPILRRHNDQDLFFDQCHPKPIANKIIAEALSDLINMKSEHLASSKL
ncbi:MAG: hypothetical protein R3A13_06250 [Bdellovibrionota bacterium]